MLVLNFKLTLDEIEQEVYAGKALDAGERIIWKRWLESQNQKSGRRSRLRAPCCGKSTFRFRLVPDGEGYFYCRQCWDAASQAQWQAELSEPQLTQQETKANHTQCDLKREAPPPWRQHLPKKKKHDLTTDEMDELLLGLEAVVT